MNSRRYKYQNNNSHLQQQRNLFLPIMLCSRSSLKDVKLSHRRASSSDAASPKIGCAGQVKRNNKVTGFSPSSQHHHPRLNSSSNADGKTDHNATTTTTTSINSVKYKQIRRFFSSKSLTTSPTAAADSGPAQLGKSINNSYNSRNRRNYSCTVRSKCDGDSCKIGIDRDLKPVKPVNIAELDPPLPVVRRPPSQPGSGEGREKESLWKRRSGGAALRSLQVQSIHGGATNLRSVEANTV